MDGDRGLAMAARKSHEVYAWRIVGHDTCSTLIIVPSLNSGCSRHAIKRVQTPVQICIVASLISSLPVDVLAAQLPRMTVHRPVLLVPVINATARDVLKGLWYWRLGPRRQFALPTMPFSTGW